MSSNKGFAILDLGSSEVKVLVGRRNSDKLDILGVGTAKSYGIKNGMILDIEEAAKSIASAVIEAENMTGLNIREIGVGLKGQYLACTNTSGGVSISSIDNEITLDDVGRAVENSKKVGVPYGNEIMHILPRKFCVDGYDGIRNPVGMSGIRLDAESHIVIALATTLKNLRKTLERANLKTTGIVSQCVSSGYFSLTENQKDLGVLLIDIGRDGTSFSIFESGEILLSGFSPIGSEKITSDISIGLKVPNEIAERIKIRYGSIDTDITEDEVFNLKEFNDLSDYNYLEEKEVSKKFLNQIISARTKEIFNSVFNSIKHSNKEVDFPSGVVLIGGGANLNGITKLARRFFGLPAQVAYPTNISSGVGDQLMDPKFVPSVSTLHWFTSPSSPTDFAGESIKVNRNKTQVTGVMKWIKSLLP